MVLATSFLSMVLKSDDTSMMQYVLFVLALTFYTPVASDVFDTLLLEVDCPHIGIIIEDILA